LLTQAVEVALVFQAAAIVVPELYPDPLEEAALGRNAAAHP